MIRELCGCQYILHVTHGLGLCRLVQILWSKRDTACRINPPQLIITVYYYTAYPVTWLSSVELLWVDPSPKMSKS